MIFVAVGTIRQLHVAKITLMIVVIVHTVVYGKSTIVADVVAVKIQALTDLCTANIADMVYNIIYGAYGCLLAAEIT